MSLNIRFNVKNCPDEINELFQLAWHQSVRNRNKWKTTSVEPGHASVDRSRFSHSQQDAVNRMQSTGLQSGQTGPCHELSAKQSAVGKAWIVLIQFIVTIDGTFGYNLVTFGYKINQQWEVIALE